MSPLSKVFLTTTLLLALSACGGSSSPTPTPTSAPSTAASLSLSFTPAKNFHFTWTDVAGATYYKLKEAETIGSGYTSLDDNIAATGGANSYDHIVPLYDRLNSKYILQSCNDVGCVDSDEVFTSTRVADMTSAIGYIKASNTGSNDEFGYVISLSNNGNTMAISALFEDSGATGVNGNQSDNSESDSGAVYVFIRSGKNWVQEAYLKASNTDASDYFGASISLSSDGNTLAVGASGEDSTTTGINYNQTDNSLENAGAVYVFTRSGSTWTQQAYVKPSHYNDGSFFGESLALSSDGNTLSVGAYYDSSNATGINGNQNDSSANMSGAVYVFTRSGDAWSEQAYLKASNTETDDGFGIRLALSEDGNTLAVSAIGESSGSDGINGNQSNNSELASGAVYVFLRSGSTWSQQAYIKASNSESFDDFSYSLDLSGDGNTLVVSAPREDSIATGINGDQTDNSSQANGAVYVYIRTGTNWAQQAYIKTDNALRPDWFGTSVSLSDDGNKLLVGATTDWNDGSGINSGYANNNAIRSGSVYMFDRSGVTWSQSAYIKASNTDEEDTFAYPTLSGDGNTLAVGALGEDSSSIGFNGDQANNEASRSGAVYIY